MLLVGKNISFFYSNQVPGTGWLNLGCGKQKSNCRSTALVTQSAFQRISVLSKVTCNNKSVLLFVQKKDYRSLIITWFVFFWAGFDIRLIVSGHYSYGSGSAYRLVMVFSVNGHLDTVCCSRNGLHGIQLSILLHQTVFRR